MTPAELNKLATAHYGTPRWMAALARDSGFSHTHIKRLKYGVTPISRNNANHFKRIFNQ